MPPSEIKLFQVRLAEAEKPRQEPGQPAWLRRAMRLNR